MVQLNWKALAAVVALMGLGIGGCGGSDGPDTEPVTGIVTLDGQPVEGARVVFSPGSGGGQAASGVTDAEGKYELTTFSQGDGAVVGNYNVIVTKTEGGANPADVSNLEGLSEEEKTAKAMEAYYSSDAYKQQGNPKMKDQTKHLLPQKYANAAQSGLTAQVVEGDNEHNFQLVK